MKKLIAVLLSLTFANVALAQTFSANPATLNASSSPAGAPCDTGFMKNLAVEVVESNIVDCKLQRGKKCFQAGAFWNQFWVRDTAYSSLMGLYEIRPEELKNTFRELVLMNGKNGFPKQDSAADFGAYPYQTDSIVWVVGAFELAKHTGDEEFRRFVYDTGLKMRRAWSGSVDEKDGLIFGAPSFLDSWASFPAEWRGKREVFLKNKFLSTNALWLRFEQIMVWEGQKYGDLSPEDFTRRLKEWEKRLFALNEKFYDPAKKYYTYYIGGAAYEALGNGLMQKFGFNLNKIEDVKTIELFYPAHYPVFAPKVPNNWYSETVQHVWIDGFLAGINKEPVADFCARYSYLLEKNGDIGELIQNGRMFGGSKQLWSAMGIHYYLQTNVVK